MHKETNEVLEKAHNDACSYYEEIDPECPDYTYVSAYIYGALAGKLDQLIGKTPDGW